MKLIIIRHGQTPLNEKDKIQGLSNAPLSKEGKRQAKLLGERFSKEKIDFILTSALKRAIDTGKAVARHHPRLKVISTPLLNEMSWGEWDGLTFDEVIAKYPRHIEERKKDKFNFAPPGGESPAHLQKRLIPFLKKLVKEHKGKTVMIVGHGGVNRVMMGILLEWDERKISSVFSKNTAVNILHIKEGKSRLHLFNCTRHLEE